MPEVRNAQARAIVAMLIWRKRQARADMRRVAVEVFLDKASAEMLVIAQYIYSEAHNAAEAARRMLYGIDPYTNMN